MAYAYDSDGLCTNAGLLTLSRDTNGYVSRAILGGLSEQWQYNQFGEVTGRTVSFSKTPLFVATYSRDGLGRLANVVEVISGVTNATAYQYDASSRLTAVGRNGSAAANYSYDSNDNRLQGPSVSESAIYDAQDRLVTGTFNGHNYTFTYSAGGELLSKSDSGQQWSFTYNGARNLTQVMQPDGTQVGFVLDGYGRRVGKSVNGSLTRSLLFLDGMHPIAQLDGTGSLVSVFIYATGGIQVPDYIVRSGVAYRLVSDLNGSVRLVINAQTGAIAQRLDYDEFGRVLADTNPGFQPFGFGGGLYEPEIGLVHFGARDYDPELGRWLVKDPFGFRGGPNLYAYLGNDPLNFRDPTGGGPLDSIYKSILQAAGIDINARRTAMDNLNNAIFNGSDKALGTALDANQSTLNQNIKGAGNLAYQGAQAEVQIYTAVGVAGVQTFQSPINNVPTSPLQGDNALTSASDTAAADQGVATVPTFTPSGMPPYTPPPPSVNNTLNLSEQLWQDLVNIGLGLGP